MLCAVTLAGSAAAQTTTPKAELYYRFTPPTVAFLFDAKKNPNVGKAYVRIMDVCTREASLVPLKQDLVFFTCIERIAAEEGAFLIDGSSTIICGNGGSDPSKNRACKPLPDVQRRP
jgi:hypothetical protein